MILPDILKDTNYKLAQFTDEQIRQLENGIIIIKESNGKKIPYITCVIRKKDIKLTPEEAIRQLYALVLRDTFGYSADRIEFE